MPSANVDTAVSAQIVAAPGANKTICVLGLSLHGSADDYVTVRDTSAAGTVRWTARAKDGVGETLPVCRDGWFELPPNTALWVACAARVVGGITYVIAGS